MPKNTYYVWDRAIFSQSTKEFKLNSFEIKFIRANYQILLRLIDHDSYEAKLSLFRRSNGT